MNRGLCSVATFLNCPILGHHVAKVATRKLDVRTIVVQLGRRTAAIDSSAEKVTLEYAT